MMEKMNIYQKSTPFSLDCEDIFNEPQNQRSLIFPLACCLSAVAFLLVPADRQTLGEMLVGNVLNHIYPHAHHAPTPYPVEKPRPLYPPIKNNPNDMLVNKIIQYMMRQRYKIFLGEGQYNIVYIEGMNLDGSLNENAPNHFNDLRLIIEIIDGMPRIVNKWEATTEPGIYYTQNPQDENGAFRIKPGQYTAWEIGYHWGNFGETQEGLVQIQPISGYRDFYMNYTREGQVYTGLYDINQHHANDSYYENIGYYGAGCLVGRTAFGHAEFMEILKSDVRYQKDPYFVFTTTVILAESL